MKKKESSKSCQSKSTSRKTIDDIDWDEYDYATKLEAKNNESLRDEFTPSRIVETFIPMDDEVAAKHARSAIKRQKKELNKEFREVLELERNIKNNTTNEDMEWILLGVYVDPRRKVLNERMDHLERLEMIDKSRFAEKKEGRVTEAEVERAREYPIENLLTEKPRNKKIRCVFHNEKTASMHVYKDHVYCFGCHKHADAIGLYMHMHGVDFITAVKSMI